VNTTSRIVVTTTVFTLAIVLAWRWADDIPTAPYGLFIGYTIYMIKTRRGFGDPAVISLFAFGLYAIMPSLVADPSADPSATDWGFDVQGAAFIYSVASVAMIGAIGLSFVLYGVETTLDSDAPFTTFYPEAVIAMTLSVFLIMIFITLNGIYRIGESDESYLNRFVDLSVPGAGILFLSAPLATAALCFAIVSTDRLRSLINILCAVPFALLFLALGQRKYVLLPLLLLTFRFFRIRSFLHLAIVLFAAMFGYATFNYIGFLRVSNISLSEALDLRTFALFIDGFQHNLNGEVYTLYLTAASAYEHALSASFLQNYVGAFLVLLPQFLFGNRTTIDSQFAELVAPDVADLSGGYAYSYFGEAYLAGGVVGIFLATLAMTLFLRYIFIRGNGLNFKGIWGVVSLTMTYYAMWYLRLSFTIALHEIVYQIAVIFLIHGGVRLSRVRYERVQALTTQDSRLRRLTP
jgi:hypothetical protein